MTPELRSIPTHPDARALAPAARSIRRLVVLASILGTVACDRVTKHVATTALAGTGGHSYLGDTVRLVYVENSGGFLSLGSGLPPDVRTAIFTVGTGLALFALSVLLLRRKLSGYPAIGLALFVVGGTCNWVDRVMHGSVVDFLNVGVGSVRTGVFNVADVAILLGAGMFALAELRKREHRQSAGSEG